MVLKFASAADQISKEFQVLVVHLVSAADVTFKRPRKRTCSPGLSIQLEVAHFITFLEQLSVMLHCMQAMRVPLALVYDDGRRSW